MPHSKQDGTQGGKRSKEAMTISLTKSAYQDLLLVVRRLNAIIVEDRLSTPSDLIPLVMIMERHVDVEVLKWLNDGQGK